MITITYNDEKGAPQISRVNNFYACKKRGYENIIHFWQHENSMRLMNHTVKTFM